MDGITNIIQSISEVDQKYLPILLSSIDERQSFRLASDKNVESLMVHLISGLNLPGRRHESLLVLRECLLQCSLDLIEQKASQIVTSCVKICKQKPPDFSCNLAFEILDILVKKSISLPELSKQFVGVHVAKISEVFVYVPPVAHDTALDCINTCLLTYPGPVKSSRTTLEKFVLSFINSTEKYLVRKSGKCFFLLQQFSTANVKHESEKCPLVTYQKRLLATLHHFLDVLYANCPEIHSGWESDDLLLITSNEKLSNEPVKRSAQLAVQFQNLVTYFQILLKEPYKHPKKILFKRLLDFIVRGLAINCNSLEKNPISDNVAVSILLPSVHTTLYNLLRDIISVMGTSLKAYTACILNLPVDTLKWTSKGETGGYKKNYTGLRSSVYRMVSLWCKVQKYGSCVEDVADALIEEIKFDIVPFQTELKLKMLSGSRKHLSKKARKQLHQAENKGTNLVKIHSKSGENKKIVDSVIDNSGLCIAALECLNQIISVSTSFLKPNVVKDIQDIVTVLAFQTFEYGGYTVASVYQNKMCRKMLLDVLFSLISSPHHFCPPPTELAAVIFSKSQFYDTDLAVRDTCALYCKNMEKILHPQKGSLHFPVDYQKIKNIFKETVDKTSHVNLESDNELDDDEIEQATQVDLMIKERNASVIIHEDKTHSDNDVEYVMDIVTVRSNESVDEDSVESIVELTDENVAAAPQEDRESSKLQDLERPESEDPDQQNVEKFAAEPVDLVEDANLPTNTTTTQPPCKKRRIIVSGEASYETVKEGEKSQQNGGEVEDLFEKMSSAFVDELCDES